MKKTSRMTIPELIKFVRESKGESQVEFAKRFFLDPSAVSHYEAGRREAGYKVIQFCIEFLFGYSICDKCKGRGLVQE